MPEVAFERSYCVEKIIVSHFFIPIEVINLLCVDSRCAAKHSI